MQAIILAGGLGTRLKSIVSDKPKPMAEILHKPFVEYILEELKAANIINIIFAVGYKGEAVEDYFGNGGKWGMNIQYAYEKELLGTAGAIKNASHYIKDDYVLVLNGDTYYELDYAKLTHIGNEGDWDMTIALRQVPDISRYGKIELAGHGVVAFNEKTSSHKPGLINGGVYFIKNSLIDEIPSGIISLENDLIPKWLKMEKKIGGSVQNGYFIDIGIPNDYFKFTEDIRQKNNVRMAKMLKQIDILLENKVTSASMLLSNWKYDMNTCLQSVYGVNSKEYKAFVSMKFEPESLNLQSDCRIQLEEFCRQQLIKIKNSWIEE